MNLAVSSQLGRELLVTGREADFAIRRRRALKRVDKELSRGNFKAALNLVKQLQGKPGGLRGFGATKQVPRRLISMDELELNAVELSSIRSLFDSVMDSIESCSRFDSLDEFKPVNVCFMAGPYEISVLTEFAYFICEMFQVIGLKAWWKMKAMSLFVKRIIPCACKVCLTLSDILEQHEAGHFLVGYLLGVLPKGYEVPSTEALRQDEFAAGRVKFVDFEFLKEVYIPRMLKTDIGQVSNRILNNFSCIILGGLVAAHLVFGYSKGHHSDIDKLERVLGWLGYRKSEAISQVKWAALNTVLISHRNSEARSRLAKAMAAGRSVSLCIETIENAISGKEI
ncbi:hypothetical protein Pint_19927 [Pistacia integerrima]|uniref:Uncharacterized protein n=1 Tax=Pistacia integerrima TaxID=434235 RepID=A0ACC0XDX7_9ROSI|nr:hypothetical protein Pint_19927 [Pistacia integerrima]